MYKKGYILTGNGKDINYENILVTITISNDKESICLYYMCYVRDLPMDTQPTHPLSADAILRCICFGIEVSMKKLCDECQIVCIWLKDTVDIDKYYKVANEIFRFLEIHGI